MSGSPFFSILTPTHNRAGMVATAVDSLLAQEGQEYEHLVLDGGSTDGTLDVLRRYPHLQVISQPDRGMYDALNKGLQAAHGQVIGLLNSDDRLAPGSLAAVRNAFQANPGAMAVVGTVTYERDGHEVRRRAAPRMADYWETAGRNRANFPNGWFLRREVYTQVGLFNADYRYTADYDLLIRLVLSGVRPVPIDATLYVYSIQPGSATLSPLDSRQAQRAGVLLQAYDELLRVAETYLPNRDLPAGLRRGLRACLARSGYQLAATACYHRRWQLAWDAARRSVRHQPLWPLIALAFGGRRVLQEIIPALRLDD